LIICQHRGLSAYKETTANKTSGALKRHVKLKARTDRAEQNCHFVSFSVHAFHLFFTMALYTLLGAKT